MSIEAMLFNEQELSFKIKDPEFGLELQKRLISQSEKDSFKIVYKLVNHNDSLVRRFGLTILSKINWNKNNLLTFIKKGFSLKKTSEIRYWLVAILPQLGIDPVFKIIDEYIELEEPDIIQRAWYYLNIIINSNYQESIGKWSSLQEKFKHKYDKNMWDIN